MRIGRKRKPLKHLQVLGLDSLPSDTREARRISTNNRRSARVSAITFARIHFARWPEFLLESLSILRVAVVDLGTTRRWIRAATVD